MSGFCLESDLGQIYPNGMQKLIGITSSHKEGGFQLWLQSNTGAGSMHGVLCFDAVQQCQVTAELYGVQDLIGVNAVTKKLVSSLDCRAALVQAVCMGS